MRLRITFLLLSLSFYSIGWGQNAGPNNSQLAISSLITIKGQILDNETSSPLEFATISIIDSEDKIITGGLSELNGKFRLEVKPGIYKAKIDFISYESLIIDPVEVTDTEKTIDLGIINLSPSAAILDNIEITAERSETVFALDKKVFTVGKDLANRGGSAEDVLDNVPSVTVDIDGNVSLRGSQGVRILVDGRPSGLVGVGNTNGLRSIPSNMIESVEVITNPSARYEAEGMAGIINIILKKDQNAGFNGAFDVTAGTPYALGASSNVNYRKGKLNWFLNVGLNDRSYDGGGQRIMDQIFDDALGNENRQLSYQQRIQDRGGLSHSYRFGADYFFTDKEQLTGAFLYRRSKENNLSSITYTDYTGDLGLFELTPLWESTLTQLQDIKFDNFKSNLGQEPLYNINRRTDDEIENEKNLEYSLNYRKEFSSREHTLNLSAQFREKSEVESSIFEEVTEFNLDNIGSDLFQRSNNDEAEKTWLMRLDFVRPISKDHKYELGAQTSLRRISNDFLVEEEIDGNFSPIESLNNDFNYDEDVFALYGIYGNSIDKFSYQVGLRSELSLIKTALLASELNGVNERDYISFFPSGHINYNFSETNAIQLSYSRRIRRPRFWDLNPFFTFTDNRNFFSGNPNLDPEFTDSYELGQIKYWDAITLNTSLFVRKTDASIQRVLLLDNRTTNTLTLPANLGTVYDSGLDLSVTYSGIKWLRLDANANIFRNQLTLNQEEVNQSLFNTIRVIRNYEGTVESFKEDFNVNFNETDNISWTGRLTARITVLDSDLQIRANYRAPRLSGQGSREAVASVNLGWSKDFLNKRMTLTLSVRDLFNSRKRRSISLIDEFADKSEFQWRARTATATLSYRINQKKQRGNGSQRGDGGDGEF